MGRKSVLTLAVVGACMTGSAMGDSIAVGVPVESAVPGSDDPVATSLYNSTTGRIAYYIPLNSSDYGTYGVTDVSGGNKAGTFSDSGNGDPNTVALSMYLKFTGLDNPADTATLSFSFEDLDLIGSSDPANFFESVQFFEADGSKITQHITAASDNEEPGGLDFDIVNPMNSQDLEINFSDITSLLSSSVFYVRLDFRSDYGNNWGQNTPEYLTATLETTSIPDEIVVPVPSALWAGLVGFGVIGQMRRKRRAD